MKLESLCSFIEILNEQLFISFGHNGEYTVVYDISKYLKIELGIDIQNKCQKNFDIFFNMN
jgi:hypothetical protein